MKTPDQIKQLFIDILNCRGREQRKCISEFVDALMGIEPPKPNDLRPGEIVMFPNCDMYFAVESAEECMGLVRYEQPFDFLAMTDKELKLDHHIIIDKPRLISYIKKMGGRNIGDYANCFIPVIPEIPRQSGVFTAKADLPTPFTLYAENYTPPREENKPTIIVEVTPGDVFRFRDGTIVQAFMTARDCFGLISWTDPIGPLLMTDDTIRFNGIKLLGHLVASKDAVLKYMQNRGGVFVGKDINLVMNSMTNSPTSTQDTPPAKADPS